MMLEATSPPTSSQRKRKGFPGQRLVVIPQMQVNALRNDQLLKDLFVTATGYFPKVPGHHLVRPSGIEDVILIRVLEGEGWVDAGSYQIVAKGDLIIIPAGRPHSYGAAQHNPWSVEWVHFQGESATTFAELLGVGDSGRTLKTVELSWKAPEFSQLYTKLERGFTRLHLLQTAAMLRTMISDLHTAILLGATGGTEEAVLSSVDWMLAHPSSRTSLEELAKAAGLSVPHYCSQFKRLTGYPPMEHFLRLKIQRACQMLDTTNLRVLEIATRLGWDDPLYFSRCFRKVTGKSPKHWRAKTKG